MKLSNLYPVVILAVSSVFVAGCSGSETTKKNPSKASAKSTESNTQSNTEEYISPLPDDAPVIKVGTEANYTPFEFKDQYGKVVGFDVDLLRAIGESQGFKIEVYDDPWKEVFTNLDSGKRQMVAAGLGSNVERKKKYEISNPYLVSHTELAYTAGTLTINNKADLKSLKIAGVADTNEVDIIKSEVEAVQFETYPTLFLAIQAVLKGEADAVVAESNVLHYSLNELGLDLAYSQYDSDAHVDELKGLFFVIEKGNTGLLNKVNTGLEAIKTDGTYAKLTEKWFGLDLTPALVEQRRKANK